MTREERILGELRAHLLRAGEWAAKADFGEYPDGWSCIKSTLDAVNEGDVGLALTRWDDLCSPNRPSLTKEAQNWRAD
jgi:hypothetical protein